MTKPYPQMFHPIRSGDAIRFPSAEDAESAEESTSLGSDETAEQLLERLASMDRSIRQLARELNCLGYFDDDEDGPKAA
jgi:hypothetical protein